MKPFAHHNKIPKTHGCSKKIRMTQITPILADNKKKLDLYYHPYNNLRKSALSVSSTFKNTFCTASIPRRVSTTLKRLFILPIILLLSFYGCKNYTLPKGFPKPNKMADILTEIHIMESVLNNSAAATPVSSSDAPAYYKSALEKYGYTYEQFDTIRRWYADNPELYQTVYDQVIINLSRRETELSIRLDKEKETEKLVTGDLQPLQSNLPVELWNDSARITISTTDTIDSRCPFFIDADTLSLSGMLKLTAKYKFLVDDESRTPRMMLAASYADTIADTVYLEIPHSFSQQNARLDLDLKDGSKASSIFGYLLLQDSLLNSSVEIEEISLQVIPDTLKKLTHVTQ